MSWLSCTLLVMRAAAQGSQTPQAYTPLVWDENWSYLDDSGLALDWSDRWKHLSLTDDSYLSVGGQIRERGEYIDHLSAPVQKSP